MANLIRNVFACKDVDGKKDRGNLPAALNLTGVPTQTWESAKSDTIILSNDDPDEKKLNWLLEGTSNAREPVSGDGSEFTPDDDVKVDVTLRTQLGQAPVIMLLFTANDSTSDPKSSNDAGVFRKVSISLEIGLNGRVSVVDMTGLLDDDADKQDAKEADGQKNEASELQSKMARVLEISQDIGILVEWVLRWAQQRNNR